MLRMRARHEIPGGNGGALMTALILPGLIGGPCLTVGLFVASFSALPLAGGVLVVCGVALLALGSEGPAEAPWCPIS